jgi:hypothetical protein
VVDIHGFRLSSATGSAHDPAQRRRPRRGQRFGTILGEGKVNIADIHLARRRWAQRCWRCCADQQPGPEVPARIQALPEVKEIHVFDLG